jgi:hypothetical protein
MADISDPNVKFVETTIPVFSEKDGFGELLGMARIEKGEESYVVTINFNQPSGGDVARMMAQVPGIIGIQIITLPAEQVPATTEDPIVGEPSEDL